MIVSGDPYAISKILKMGNKPELDSKDVGKSIVARLKVVLSQAGRGRLYTTYFFTRNGVVHPIGKRQPHRASAPGDPPAPDTRHLVNSVDYSVQKMPTGAEVSVGSPLNYSVFTDRGTRKMLARPWFSVTIKTMGQSMFKPWIDGIVRREREEARRLGGRG